MYEWISHGEINMDIIEGEAPEFLSHFYSNK